MLSSSSANAQQLYYFYFSPCFYLPSPVTEQNEPKYKIVETAQQRFPTPTSIQLAQPIILTREDLLRQGHQPAKKPWSKQEDRLLLRLCRNQNARFEQIAAHISGRNAKMCYSRFRRLSYSTKINWTEEEDHRLMEMVQQQGQKQWKMFEAHFKGRTHKQIRDHYENYLRPEINLTDWSVEEDVLLIDLINREGKNWDAIEQQMPGRSRSQIKNRYFGRISRLNAKKLAKVEHPNQNMSNSSLVFSNQ